MRTIRMPLGIAALGAALVLLAGAPVTQRPAAAQSAPGCVNPAGSGGCTSTIQAAVSAASAGATITVAAGTYKESVTLTAGIRLIGAGAQTTTIDATGKDNGVHITGDNASLQGFTVSGARLDGVLVNGNNASILNNSITGNATLIIPPPAGAPPVPATWNGLNLQNSSNDLVAYNNVSKNPGRGIRLEGSAIYNYPTQNIMKTVTGRSDNNLILDNTVLSNGNACGIVLSTDSSDNVVAGNTSTGNPAGIVVSGLPPFGLPNTPFADHIPHSDNNVISGNDVENSIGVGINVDPISGTANNTVVANNTVLNNGASSESNGQTVGIQINSTANSQADGTIVSGNNSSGQQLSAWVVTGSTVTNTIGIDETGASAPAATATTPAPAAAAAPASVSGSAVTIANFAFAPASITVSVGTTITWTNTDSAQHSATANDGSFDTDLLSQGQSGSVTFSTPGTFAYICSIHPFMHGTVVVQ